MCLLDLECVALGIIFLLYEVLSWSLLDVYGVVFDIGEYFFPPSGEDLVRGRHVEDPSRPMKWLTTKKGRVSFYH